MQTISPECIGWRANRPTNGTEPHRPEAMDTDHRKTTSVASREGTMQSRNHGGSQPVSRPHKPPLDRQHGLLLVCRRRPSQSPRLGRRPHGAAANCTRHAPFSHCPQLRVPPTKAPRMCTPPPPCHPIVAPTFISPRVLNAKPQTSHANGRSCTSWRARLLPDRPRPSAPLPNDPDGRGGSTPPPPPPPPPPAPYSDSDGDV